MTHPPDLPALPPLQPIDDRPLATAEPGWRRPGLTPLTLFLTLLLGYVMYKVQLVLILLLLSILFATIIERPVHVLERQRIPRGLSILLIYVAIIGTVVLGAILITPTIQHEATRFRQDAPAQLSSLRDDWRRSDSSLLNTTGADLLTRAIDQIDEPSAPPSTLTLPIVTGVTGGVVGLFTLLIITFYYMMEKQFLRRLVLNQVNPPSRERVSRVWEDVEAQVGRWMRGQLTLCLIIGTASLIGYGSMGIRFWPLLGLWAGITEAIPIVGPWFGGIPAVVIAMTQSWDKALMVGAFVVLLQLTENAVLVPRVMKGAVGLTPLTVFVAILVGTELRGIPGALLAIPVAAAVQVIVADYFKTRRGGQLATDPLLPNWRWMRGTRASPIVSANFAPSESTPAAPASGPATSTGAPASWTGQVLAQVSGQTHHPEKPNPTG